MQYTYSITKPNILKCNALYTRGELTALTTLQLWGVRQQEKTIVRATHKLDRIIASTLPLKNKTTYTYHPNDKIKSVDSIFESTDYEV